MREVIQDRVNAWFVENRDDETGEYPDFPDAEDGGSKLDRSKVWGHRYLIVPRAIAFLICKRPRYCRAIILNPPPPPVESLITDLNDPKAKPKPDAAAGKGEHGAYGKRCCEVTSAIYLPHHALHMRICGGGAPLGRSSSPTTSPSSPPYVHWGQWLLTLKA
eukprot:scaffold21750_cov19-Tisochrysis_lutea.AAC.3